MQVWDFNVRIRYECMCRNKLLVAAFEGPVDEMKENIEL